MRAQRWPDHIWPHDKYSDKQCVSYWERISKGLFRCHHAITARFSTLRGSRSFARHTNSTEACKTSKLARSQLRGLSVYAWLLRRCCPATTSSKQKRMKRARAELAWRIHTTKTTCRTRGPAHAWHYWARLVRWRSERWQRGRGPFLVLSGQRDQ